MKSNKIIKDIILILIIGIAIFAVYEFYMNNYYDNFLKAEYNKGVTVFSRDKHEKYSGDRSYKIESKDFNDACFYKEVKVKPNTPYRISCMIKTDNVIAKDNIAEGGAQIFLVETVEHSNVIQGTTDWTKVEFMFNSKSKDTIKIGFRLGGNEFDCKGTAWFTDFKLEQGTKTEDTNWKMACFILKNVNVNIDNKDMELGMNLRDVDVMNENMERFKLSCEELSEENMKVTYDVYEIDEPVTSLTYSDSFGYYIGQKDVKRIIDPYLKGKEYDYIFTVVRLGSDEQGIEIPTYSWIGLGGMDYEGIGYSNIRLPNSNKNYVYTFDYRINIFPEEVFIHEFLHTLERLAEESGYERPELHDNEVYGYTEKNLTGLREWYRDYMLSQIKDNNGNYIGIAKEVYKMKPPHEENFKYAIEIDFARDPKNIIEALNRLFKKED